MIGNGGDPSYETTPIPDEPSYWDQLSTRITSAAVRDYHATGHTVGAPRWLLPAAGGALVAAAIIAIVSIRAPVTPPQPQLWSAAFLSTDDLGNTLIVAARPPSIAELLVQRPPSTSQGSP
jgi:hypothetical protein